MNKVTPEAVVKKVLGPDAEVAFSQEIDETTQPEAISKLVESSREFFQGVLPVMDHKGQLTTGYLHVESSTPWAKPQWVGVQPEPEQLEVYFCKGRVVDYAAAETIAHHRPSAQGIRSLSVLLEGSKSLAPHPLECVRELGSEPMLTASTGQYARIQFEDVQSLVLVQKVGDKSFIAVFSDIKVDYARVCGATEELYLSATGMLPYVQV